ETVGIQKTFEKIEQAQLVIYLMDGTTLKNETDLKKHLTEIKKIEQRSGQKKILVLLNKTDQLSANRKDEILQFLNENILEEVLSISAKDRTGIENLIEHLQNLLNKGALSNNQTIVSNARHFDALHHALKSTQDIVYGLDQGISSDLIAIDIRQALYHLGEITGQITSDDLLGHIFANFCIGK
ncbi:MAG: tRNA uridine-5-carboxymethylaminomethyl(34) synthesis GTPase MnmE, partial [Lutimonas sp.]